MPNPPYIVNGIPDYPDKFVSEPEDIPNVVHYAIFEGTSAGDDYGGRQNFIQYKAYLNREHWEIAIKYEMTGEYGAKGKFRAAIITPVKIDVNIKIGG